MFKTVFGAALLSAAVIAPAEARMADSAQADADAVAALNAMGDPERVDAMADLAESVVGAVMQMPVGQIANAVRRVDPNSRMGDLPDDATVADLAGRDGRPVDQGEARESARAAAYMMGDMSRQLAAMLPALTAMARDMAAQFEGRMADARRRARN